MYEANRERDAALYRILGRIGWAFRKKQFSSRWARLRGVLLILSGHETEICSECGGAVGVVWWCDEQPLWEKVTGEMDGGGTWCPRCFHCAAKRQGEYLRWAVRRLD